MKVKQTKYSFENPEVWIATPEESAKKEIPMLINLFKKFGKVKNVLDVGCGMGRHAYLLSKEGYICEGVEPHPKMVKYAKEHYPGVIYKENKIKEIINEWINTNNQSYVSERTYYDLVTDKKKGYFTKESRMF